MAGLLDAPGHYRRSGVRVVGSGRVHHVGPPAARVPGLMADLLAWLGAAGEHPLIASSVFHYEFEFIHPFEDGNGRLGRLWQTLILTRWKALFAHVPVESLVHARQGDYYDAIRRSSAEGESTAFVASCWTGFSRPSRPPKMHPPSRAAVAVLTGEMSRRDILRALGLSDRKSLRESYLSPALRSGYVEMTRPESPTTQNQKYRLTPRGRAKLDQLRSSDE